MNARRSRLFAAFLLGLYALIGTPAASMTFVVLAHCNDAHEVQVHSTADGIHVVLHHRTSQAGKGLHDHHNRLARALTCLCGVNPEGDHVFSHASSTTSLTPASGSTKERSIPMTASSMLSFATQWWRPSQAGQIVVRLNAKSSTRTRSLEPRAGLGTIALLV